MSSAKYKKYKNILKSSTVRDLNFTQLQRNFLSQMVMNRDLQSYNQYTDFIGFSKDFLKSVLGDQDGVMDLSHRNWIWILEDGPLMEGISEDLIFTFWYSTRGISIELAKKDGTSIDYDDERIGNDCVQFYKNIVKVFQVPVGGFRAHSVSNDKFAIKLDEKTFKPY